MRSTLLIAILFSLFISCEKSSRKPFDLKSLPGDWVRLTATDSGLIVFNSCNMGNLLIRIDQSGPEPLILMHGQQEDDVFKVLDAYTYPDDTVRITAKWFGSGGNMEIKFFWKDKSKGLAVWKTEFPDGGSFEEITVTSEKQKNYPYVKQPCRECWDECDE